MFPLLHSFHFVSTDQAEANDVEICCPITCGDSKAVLLIKKFVCPGINVKCVKVGMLSLLVSLIRQKHEAVTIVT